MNSKEFSKTLIVKDLYFKYESKNLRSKKFAITGVSFELCQGDSIGIIGRNGSGKSTLAKLLSGVLYPDQGDLIINGSVAPLIELGAGFDFEMTAYENILLYGLLLGIPYTSLKSGVTEILEFAELSKFSDAPLRTFSSGMVARLGFSIASFAKPDLLIVDEILSVGDQEFAKKSRNRIDKLLSKSTACVLVSHDFEAVRDMTTNTIWMEDGRIRDFGDSIQVTDRYMKAM